MGSLYIAPTRGYFTAFTEPSATARVLPKVTNQPPLYSQIRAVVQKVLAQQTRVCYLNGVSDISYTQTQPHPRRYKNAGQVFWPALFLHITDDGLHVEKGAGYAFSIEAIAFFTRQDSWRMCYNGGVLLECRAIVLTKERQQ